MTTQALQMAVNMPQPRQVKVPFSVRLHRFWCGGYMFPTLLMNGFTIYIPIIERFMIARVRAAANEVTDPDLKKRVDAFLLQEAIHAREHEQSRQFLHATEFRSQGIYKGVEFFIDRIMTPMANLGNRVFGRHFSLATVAGAEHWTAATAEINLSYKILWELEGSPMLWLFAWHGAEEIEHKDVVFDMIQHLKVGYLLRMISFLSATLAFGLLNLVVTTCLIFQLKWKEALHPQLWVGGLYYLFIGAKVVPKGLVAMFDYMRPSFHPNDRDDRELMEMGFAIARKGMADGMVMEPFVRSEAKAA
ncbi:MAG TPA: metal-dependent hydrolase [Dongiaceae bacterium]|nr:metal-dependent hydrolase [Dongiaceae bacterium]